MNGWDGALITALLAVLAFVVGQALLRFVVEPIQEQRRLIGEVSNALLFYANVYHLELFKQPDERQREQLDEARTTLRGLAGRLQASLWTVPAYDTLARIGWVRKKEDILTASRELVGWSNSLYGGRTSEQRDRRRTIIAEVLGITQKVGPPE
ncbi:MAG: hypothetical protein H0T55_01850 [Rubrobacteraceae bacterium]|jgi:hypothetical protein|nr:hypothetical protein [Rubrobacteraceae bacterium]